MVGSFIFFVLFKSMASKLVRSVLYYSLSTLVSIFSSNMCMSWSSFTWNRFLQLNGLDLHCADVVGSTLGVNLLNRSTD